MATWWPSYWKPQGCVVDGVPMKVKNVGLPLMAVAESLTDSLGARLVRVPGYYPHTQRPAAVNAALREFWDSGT